MKVRDLPKLEFTMYQPVWVVEMITKDVCCRGCNHCVEYTYTYKVRKDYITGIRLSRWYGTKVPLYDTLRYHPMKPNIDAQPFIRAIYGTRDEAIIAKERQIYRDKQKEKQLRIKKINKAKKLRN